MSQSFTGVAPNNSALGRYSGYKMSYFFYSVIFEMIMKCPSKANDFHQTLKPHLYKLKDLTKEIISRQSTNHAVGKQEVNLLYVA